MSTTSGGSREQPNCDFNPARALLSDFGTLPVLLDSAATGGLRVEFSSRTGRGDRPTEAVELTGLAFIIILLSIYLDSLYGD
jgi:hypothetical protein